MTIYLDIVLPQYSSNLPKSKASSFIGFLFGFASGWGLQCLKCYHLSGKLLPYHFTLTKINWRYIFCCTIRRLTSPRRYLAPCSLKSGLSSNKLAIIQPTRNHYNDFLFFYKLFIYIPFVFS